MDFLPKNLTPTPLLKARGFTSGMTLKRPPVRLLIKTTDLFAGHC